MAGRLEVIEELKVDFEVPYVTSKGEPIESLIVEISERRQGVDIGYVLLEPTAENLNNLFPSEGVDQLGRMTRQIMKGLEMKPKRIVLQLWEYSPAKRSYSAEGRAPVNKQRDTVVLILTKNPFVYKYGYEIVLWHQAMHAKDRWEYRFPAAHPLVYIGEWLDALWHFSIDGRLQSLGKPHYSRDERLEEAIGVLRGLCQFDAIEDRVGRLCEELWGKEVTMAGLLEIGKSLGLEPAARGRV